MLTKILDMEEVKAVVFSLDPSSPPSLDGFTSLFFQSCQGIVNEDIIRVIQPCFISGILPNGVKDLIPKILEASKIEQY